MDKTTRMGEKLVPKLDGL